MEERQSDVIWSPSELYIVRYNRVRIVDHIGWPSWQLGCAVRRSSSRSSHVNFSEPSVEEILGLQHTFRAFIYFYIFFLRKRSNPRVQRLDPLYAPRACLHSSSVPPPLVPPPPSPLCCITQLWVASKLRVVRDHTGELHTPPTRPCVHRRLALRRRRPSCHWWAHRWPPRADEPPSTKKEGDVCAKRVCCKRMFQVSQSYVAIILSRCRSGYCKSRSEYYTYCNGYTRMFQVYVLSVSSVTSWKKFICCKCFHLDIAKVDLNVTYIMHLASVCFECFIRRLQVFHLHVAYCRYQQYGGTHSHR
jgi:hypothetical protein